MSADPNLDRLLQAYLDGVASPSDTAELAELLVRDPAAAEIFARAVRFEALLQTHLTEERQAREWALPNGVDQEAVAEAAAVAEPENVVELPVRRRRRWAAVAALATAAMLLIAVRWWGSEAPAQTLLHQVTAGRVLVDGIEAKSFADGSRLEVLGSSSAAIHLADGNDFELTPATSAVIRREGGEAIVRLDYGNAKFRGGAAKRPLRVDTPLGAVSGRSADFAVDLQPADLQATSVLNAPPDDDEPDVPSTFHASLPAFLVVAVLTGQVEVEEADRKVKVSAGESRAFAQEKIPAFAGKVVEVSADGKRITLEGKRSKPGAPPQRREVLIKGDTQLTYYGAALGDDRPTVGAWALATLDASSPDTAVAIEFGNRSPTVSGTVLEVSSDSRRLKLEIFRKGAAPLERTIVLDDRTRTSFRGFDSNTVQATVGYQAWVWLAGESDLAAEVRFLFKTKGPVAKPTGDNAKNLPTKKPDLKTMKSESKPTDKPDPKVEVKPGGKSNPKSGGKPDSKKEAKPGAKSALKPGGKSPDFSVPKS